uniref:SAM domain-containing protein n=1 Tax=Tetradesmus obliquus TaxID=3088 RepID=A0A383VMM1_TETOB|eukprot:jgi/Sobl393_1/1442/SZX66173.1
MAELAVAELMQLCRERLSPVGAFVVAKYKDKLVQAGFVSVQAVRDASDVELEGAGLSIGAASALKSAIGTTYTDLPACPCVHPHVSHLHAFSARNTRSSTRSSSTRGSRSINSKSSSGRGRGSNSRPRSQHERACCGRSYAAMPRPALTSGGVTGGKYKDKLVEAGFVSVQAIRYATAEELEGAGLSIGAASALKSAVGTTYTGVCVDVTHTGALPSRSANNMGLLRQVRRAAQEDACTQPEDDCEPRQRLLANYDGRPHAD